jgi:hypothetical protein
MQDVQLNHFTVQIPLIYNVPDHFPNVPILLAQKPLTSHLDFTILTEIGILTASGAYNREAQL